MGLKRLKKFPGFDSTSTRVKDHQNCSELFQHGFVRKTDLDHLQQLREEEETVKDCICITSIAKITESRWREDAC